MARLKTIEAACADLQANGGLKVIAKGARGEDWYKRRDELQPGLIFLTHEGSVVRLDRMVPGDGTKWYVADWWNDSWSYMDSTIEPGDLRNLIPGREEIS